MSHHALRRPRPRSLLAALLAAALVLPLSALLVAPAVAAQEGRTATLVGSLQSELGCAGNWAPSCQETLLGPVAGAEVWEGDFLVPAGTWQYKVAMDGSWATAYPVDNLTLTLPVEATVRFRLDEEAGQVTARVVALDASYLAPTGVTALDRDYAQRSLRAGLTRENYYFVMADRFADGDESNNTAGIAGDRLAHGYDPTDKGFYHGGDLAGVLDKMDYIEGLGTTAIWLTPSFKNRPVQGSGDDVSAGYHGYWITDFTEIDPHLGTNEEMKALVAEAHDRGMKVFFDIITNHTADVIDYRENTYDYVSTVKVPYVDAAGNKIDIATLAGGGTFPLLDPEGSFPYTPYFRTPEDATVKEPAWLNDVTLYHNRGNTNFAKGEIGEYGDFVGLDDLMTEHPTVVDGMGKVYEAWVDLGIDGFRIDTVRHVNKEFWQDFSPRLTAHAAGQGNDDFFMFGEVYDGDPAYVSQYTTEADLQATIDFPFQDRATTVARGGPTESLADLFADDDWYTDANSNAYSSPTFLGNHDMGRINRFVGTDLANRQVAPAEALDRSRLAHEIMYLTRGQPVVYYGDEQGFTGDGGDKDARQDMFPSAVDSYNDDDLLGTDATTAVANFDTGHPLYTHIAGLAALREAHPALTDGTQVNRFASDEAGLFVVSRIDRESGVEYLVAVNNAETPQTATVPSSTLGGSLKPVYGGGNPVRTDKEGRVDVTVPALSSRVWRADRAVSTARGGSGDVILTSPAEGGSVTPLPGAADGRAEIRAAVPSGALVDVTFLSRPVGTEVWTLLGTDDNAPYRVFDDVSDLPVGTLVEYRAVALDRQGRVTADGSWGTVTAPGAGGGPEGPGTGVGDVDQPAAVSVPGDHNSEMGCSGDWQPDCTEAQLALRADEIWSGSSSILAGSYQFKAAINKSWTENYGLNAAPNGDNIPYTLAATSQVGFYYDHRTKHVWSTAEGPIVTAVGSFQKGMGCATNWAPDCLRSWLQDPDRDGVYTLATTQIPAGTYEVKAALNQSWDVNYGAGGAPNGPNISFSTDGGTVAFRFDSVTNILTVSTGTTVAPPDLTLAKAHWLSEEWIAWPTDSLPAGVDPATLDWRLHFAADGGLELESRGVTGGDSVPLTWDPDGLPPGLQEEYRNLADHVALRLDQRTLSVLKVDLDEVLSGQTAVVQYDDSGVVLDAAALQIAGVLDDRFAGAVDADLGAAWSGTGRNARPTLSVWAPTAKDVQLLRWPASGAGSAQVVDMQRDGDGVWSVRGASSWRGSQYEFRVTVWAPSTGQVEVNDVTDPYSVALTTNSARSVLVDLDDPAFAPAQWRTAPSPSLAQPEDMSVYELHVRDFSVDDRQVPAAHRGRYLAFADAGQGRQHLQELAKAGLTTVHLLPTFDIASIEEDPAAQLTPACDLPSYPPDSTEQQACVSAVADRDAFNWGYDPYHWMAPEGSYAVQRDGGTRVAEFRTMVGALHADGLQVVLDVVFNHTASSGQADTSVLDKIVPGYYHRLNAATGAVETSTCCQNIATEHAMAEKIMVDSLVVWARDYKVDGFRFDLMGHHSLENMQAVRDALDALTMGADGVDGSSVVLYGEGWNFGEVADDARFDQARQGALDGTEIGTFSDRLRDAVRGGGPFDDDPRVQGLGSGLYTDPNGASANGSTQQQLAELLLAHDTVKLGLAGNLRDYAFIGKDGVRITGVDVDYNGSPAGYAEDPSQVITYVDAHDNETLWDALTYKLPQDTPMADRVRMNTVSLSTTALGQSASFWHAGADLLRSKSLDRNSYNSGDWFNHIGWDGADNGFGRGLPPAPDNESKWVYARPLLADPALAPSEADVEAASAAATDLLRIRYSSPLFRLGDAGLIRERVAFPIGGTQQAPGVVVMYLDDTVGTDLDPRWEGVLVVVNSSPDAVSQTVAGLVGADLGLHPVQVAGADDVVRSTTWDAATGPVTVPARTVSVLVRD